MNDEQDRQQRPRGFVRRAGVWLIFLPVLLGLLLLVYLFISTGAMMLEAS